MPQRKLDPPSEDDKATLIEVYSKEFRVKQRVTILMGRDKDQVDKLKQEIVKTIRDIAEKFGMITASTSTTAQEKENVEERLLMQRKIFLLIQI